MDILRIIIGTLVCWGFVFILGKYVFVGFKTGITYGSFRSEVKRNKNPIKFWSLMLFYSASAALFIYAWIKVILLFELSNVLYQA
ncbi:MAG: hypothetical protein KKE31_05320 [Planctomycetes bacterium]|nr:hypothetical protein [Planctomycetota bacterium]MBU1518457.1 hypothetical protein [Planctomycetota bacterium]MBU2458025.1 hypothetical protein [Planctomycetota bacterium]